MSRPIALLVAGMLALLPLAPAIAQSASLPASVGSSVLPAAQDEVVYVDAEGIERGVVTIEEVEDPFEDYPEDRPPAEDARYILLTVAFEATGEEAFEANPRHLLLRDTDGYLWGQTSVPREDDAFPELRSSTLAPGNRVSGVVGFVVAEDAELAEVFYQPESGRLIRLADLREDPAPGPEVETEVPYADAEGVEGLVTVSEITDPFEGYPEDRPPAEDTRYVLLTVAFEATGDAAFDAGPSQLLLRDADGFLWGYTSVPREDDAFPALSSQTLAPGNRISGVIGFIVPEDAELAEVLYQPESGRLIVLADLAADDDRREEEAEEDEDADEDADEEAASGVDGNTYTSPTYGYTLEWDPEVWEVFDAGVRDDGTNDLMLSNPETLATLLFFGEQAYDGDPVDCLEGISEELAAFAEGDVVELDAGREEDRAFAAWAYSRAVDGEEEEFIAYGECRTLVAGEAVLIITQISGADTYEDDADAAQEVLDTLELADPEATEPDEDDADSEEDEGDEEESASGVYGNTYTSPTYGYSLE